jgi:excisionase family DNA binding protein
LPGPPVPAAHLVGMKTETNPLSGLDPLLSITELAEYLGVPVKTIYEWRQSGRGPACVRIGRHLKFAVSDVRAWVECQRESPRDHSEE